MIRGVSHIQSSSIKRIVFISLTLLLFAEIAQTTNFGLYAIGIVVCSLIAFFCTLGRNRLFEFLMVMYVCNLFPAQLARAGLFPIVAFLCLMLALAFNIRLREIVNKDRLFYWLIFILFFSTVLGWLFFNKSDTISLLIAICSFIGTLFLFVLSGQIVITEVRIIQFLKLNIFLAAYALVASVNTMFKIIPKMLMFPQWAGDWINADDLFDAGAGGIIGVSTYNGQHNMLLAVLFATFYFFSLSGLFVFKQKKALLIGFFLTVVNVFTSGSKAVFSATVVLIIIVYFLQGKIQSITNISKKIYETLMIAILLISIFFIVSALGFDHVFERFDKQMEVNEANTGAKFSLETILDGSALNRGTAYEAAFYNYNTRNWFIGYGYSTTKFQIDAFYGNSKYRILRGGGMHTNYFSTLFLFGWLGFIPFWLLHIRGITKSYRTMKNKSLPVMNRILALAFAAMIMGLMLHGMTADNTWCAGYFTSTLIIIGLSYANTNISKIVYYG